MKKRLPPRSRAARSPVHGTLVALGLSSLVVGAVVLLASRKAAISTPATPGTVLVVPQRALPTGFDGTRPNLLSTPPVPLTMGTMGGNVHVRMQRALAPDRVIGVVVAIESTSDVEPFRTTLIPIAGEPTIEFDPRSASMFGRA